MPALIDGFAIDCIVNESHTRSSEVTKFPVESGSDLTDHVIKQPKELSLEGIVSDTPVGEMATIRDAANVTLGDDDIADAVLPSDQAIAHLERIWEEKRVVTIQTTLGARKGSPGGKLYEQMEMVELEIPRDPTTGNALRFTAKFEQITIVTNERTTVPTATPGGSKGVKLGSRGMVVEKVGSKSAPARETSEQMWFDPEINCWRHTWDIDVKNNEIDYQKGNLRDGFLGTDAEMRAYIAKFPDGPRNDRFLPKGFGRPGQLSHGNVGKNRVVPKTKEEAAEMNRKAGEESKRASDKVAGADNLARKTLIDAGAL